MTTTKWLFVLFVAVVVVERVAETRFSRWALRGQRLMAWSLPAFAILHGGIVAGMTTEFFLWSGPWDWRVGLTGLVLFSVAMALRLAAIRALGRFWSLDVEIRPDHRLVREGIYARIRHPAYAAVILEFVGMNLVANARWTLLATVLAYFPLLGLRLVHEEKALIEKFGDAYRRYRQEVPALLPIRLKAA